MGKSAPEKNVQKFKFENARQKQERKNKIMSKSNKLDQFTANFLSTFLNSEGLVSNKREENEEEEPENSMDEDNQFNREEKEVRKEAEGEEEEEAEEEKEEEEEEEEKEEEEVEEETFLTQSLERLNDSPRERWEEDQLKQLQKLFQAKPFRSREECFVIARKISCKPTSVWNWFKNNRNKHKIQNNNRHNWNEEDKQIMEDFFKENAYPSRLKRRKLSEETEHTMKSVNSWFKNRRAKAFKQGEKMAQEEEVEEEPVPKRRNKAGKKYIVKKRGNPVVLSSEEEKPSKNKTKPRRSPRLQLMNK
eukprot:TRINITY_DN618_c1_g1_i1.p1 TRINITY_DN618_c1_g1~~TRINITY_DN618_c1_g1_i1.p1  ORF type:complete len:305 (-),score=104.91 TRINITY_DN618_c1_g1_i1:59-973(-)